MKKDKFFYAANELYDFSVEHDYEIDWLIPKLSRNLRFGIIKTYMDSCLPKKYWIISVLQYPSKQDGCKIYLNDGDDAYFDIESSDKKKLLNLFDNIVKKKERLSRDSLKEMRFQHG